MNEILTSAILISILHAILPNHWLPILAIGKQRNWSSSRLIMVTFFTGLTHALSTILLGFTVAFLGWKIRQFTEEIFHWIAPALMIILGIWFIYRHHTHHHFHIDASKTQKTTDRTLIFTLATAMFFSPCLEIEAFFAVSGGVSEVLYIAFSYLFITVIGMVGWIWFMHTLTMRLNWHKIEHNAGLISGGICILTGIWMAL